MNPRRINPPPIAADPASLADACRALREAGRFGFDTEFIRERSYAPQVCLIQAATTGRVVLIDPLAVDPAPFWELVLDGAVEKIVHSGEQDLEMCYLHTGQVPANVFDVQVAGGLAGTGYPLSYGNLLREVLAVEVEQISAFSEWSQRPLADEQLRYAVEDVAYLSALEAELRDRLEGLGRVEWMAEEMSLLTCPQRYDQQPIHVARRIRSWDRLSRRQLAILCELIAWRERAARGDDVPPRTLLRDAVLVATVRAIPASVPELAAVKGFPRPLARRRGEAVLEALARGRDAPRAELPEAAARETNRPLVSWAMEAGRQICEAARLDHSLFASRRNYIDLVEALRTGQRDRTPLRLLTGWRAPFAGERIADLITKRLRGNG